jgi:hypothetical protein
MNLNIILIFATVYNYDRLLSKNYKSDIEFHFEPETEFLKNQSVTI